MSSNSGRNAEGFCFVAGTSILAVDTSGAVVKKAIENVSIGDGVISYNEVTGQVEIRAVTQTFTSNHTELINITDSNGQKITSSLGHPYYTQRGWIMAENLRVGDILQTVNGETVVVELLQHELLESSQMLYNFEVEGNHNYYVAESVEASIGKFLLVHNTCEVGGRISDTLPDGYETNLKNDLYKNNSKHGMVQRGKISAKISSDKYVQYALDNAIPAPKGKALYAYNGKNVLQFMPDNTGTWHGFVVVDLAEINSSYARDFLRYLFNIK